MFINKGVIGWASILTIACMAIVTPVPVTDLVVSRAVALAQCDPPGPNTKCWDGEAALPKWSLDANWNPDEVPQATDSVFHLIGGTIQMDVGTAQTPAPINSFTFNPGGSLIVQTGKGLSVAGDFTSLAANPVDLYNLTVESLAKLEVDGDLDRVNAVVEEGLVGDFTDVAVLGMVGSGNWSIARFALLATAGGIDLSGLPGNTWTIEGTIYTWGSIVGAGAWTLGDSDVTTPIVRVFDSSMQVNELVVGTGANVLIGAISVNTLEVGQTLFIDGGLVETERANIVADPGSLITLINGGLLTISQTAPPEFPSEVGSLEYGHPGVVGSVTPSADAI